MHSKNIKNSKLAVLGGCVLAAASATTMQAREAAPGFYMSTDAGVNLMSGIRGKFDGGGGGSLRLDVGGRWGLEAGYGFKLADKLTLGVEAESGFIWNGTSSFEGGAESELGGNLYQVPVLGKVVLNYQLGKFTPYISAGGGVDYISLNAWSSGNAPAVIAGSDWGPAVQAEAGVHYQLSEHVQLGLGYKYLTAFSEKIAGDRLSEVNNHTIGINLTYTF